MSSNHNPTATVNGKEKKGVHMYPSTVNSEKNWMKKNAHVRTEKQKEIPWSAVIYSHMGLKGSEYHASYSVNQSTLTHTPHTHGNELTCTRDTGRAQAHTLDH